MATTIAPQPLARLDHNELRRFLNALRVQLWWREALLLAAASAIAGAVLGAAALMWPTRVSWTDYGSIVAVWLTSAALAVGLVVAVVRRPSVLRAARVADRQLGT